LIFENNLNGKQNFLDLELKNNNSRPYGAKVEILDNDNYQLYQLKNASGYQSMSQSIIHFGLGKKAKVDSLLITWHNGKQTLLKNLDINKTHKIDYNPSNHINLKPENNKPIFIDITSNVNIKYIHKEKKFNDYEDEVLLPHKLSQEGPFIDVVDVNGDDLEDFFVGSGVGFSGQLFIQNKNGKFSLSKNEDFENDKLCEDLGVLFFDADNDGDQDLYVVSGSNEYDVDSPYLQDRIYINDGKGNFTKAVNMLPNMLSSGLNVTAADYDSDGDLDLFICGYLSPQNYPKPGHSYLLENINGVYKDVTKERATDLHTIGMVKDAKFADINNDKKLDLILAGHWMPIEIYINTGENFIKATEDYKLSKQIGWWNSLVVKDIDNDGFNDIIAGNLGLNTKHKASLNEPFKVYAKDFDNSGTNDIVLGYYNHGNLYPVRGKQCSSEQLPELDTKIESYNEFGSLLLDDIYGESNLKNAVSHSAYNFKTTIFKNIGGNTFNDVTLPNEVQFAPTNAMIPIDFNKDGIDEIAMAGNHFPVEVETGRYDAHTGNILQYSSKDNTYLNVPLKTTNFFIDSDVRSLKTIIIDGKTCVIVASNRDTLKIFEYKN